MGIISKNPFEKKELEWIKNTSENSEIEKNLENTIVDYNSCYYEDIDKDTIKFLKQQEIAMTLIVNKAYTKLGETLYKTQEVLAQRGYGCFLAWVEGIGLKKTKAYTLIDRYKLLLNFQNSEKAKIIEAMPISLAYEISKQCVNQDLKALVLEGEIKTLKEYREFEKFTKNSEINKDDDLISSIAKLISKNRSFDEASDYKLAELIANKFL